MVKKVVKKVFWFLKRLMKAEAAVLMAPLIIAMLFIANFLMKLVLLDLMIQGKNLMFAIQHIIEESDKSVEEHFAEKIDGRVLHNILRFTNEVIFWPIKI